MADTPVGSLSEFLAKRAAMKSATPADQVTQAPTPQSENPATPSKMAPPPKTAVYAQKYQPSFLRKTLGAVANEALGGSGHAGRTIAGRISGDHLVNSSYVRVSPATSATTEGVDLSTPGKSPSDVNIGIAKSVKDIEAQVIRVDKEVKDWGKYVTKEFSSVRSDIKGVLDTTRKTQADVDRMKKDLAEETFRKRVADAKIRGKNGRLMSADQVQKNPYDVHPDQSGLAGGFIKDLEAWAAGGAIGGAGLLAKKKLTNIFRKKAVTGATEEAVKVAEEGAVKTGASALEKKAVESMASRVGKTIVSRKGGSIGTAIDVLQTMKSDSQSGNHLRTWLRSKLGIEDPGEAAPWSGAISNDDYDASSKDKEKDKTAKEEESGKIKSDGDVVLESKKNVSIKSVLDILIEARNELTLKARVIILDADRLELKGNIKSLGGIGEENTSHTQDPTEHLSTNQMRLQSLIEKHGPQKGQEIYEGQNSAGLPSLLNRINPFSSKSETKSGGAGGDAERQVDQTPNGSLSSQRSKFEEEIKNTPGLYEKILRIAANEQGKNPEGTQAVIESMMNRAIVRGTTLEKQARWHESEGGYYQQGSMGRGSLEDPKWKEVLEGGYKKALGGSNISKYATDNASGSLAAREQADGSFRYTKDFNGETFFAPGTAESRLSSKWDQWKQSTEQAYAQRNQEKTQNTINQFKNGVGSEASVDLALQERGLHEIHDRSAIKQYLKDGGINLDPATTAWCAAFVNSTLAQTGIKGTGSAAAGSFQTWGAMSDAEHVKKGDVLVNKDYSPRTGMTGSHVGFATGEVRRDGNGNVSSMKMISGNESDMVKESWENVSNWNVRTATEKQLLTKKKDEEAATALGKTDGIPVADTSTRSGEDITQQVKDSTRNLRSNDQDKSLNKQPAVQAPDDSEETKPGVSIDQEASDDLAKAFKRADEKRQDADPVRQTFQPGESIDTDAANSLDRAFTDADVAKTDFSKAVPVPDTSTSSGDEITQQIKDQVDRESATNSQPSSEPKGGAVGSQGSGTGGNANEKIATPRHHPESEAPRPGSDGYGDQQHNPDDCGICGLQ